MKRAGYINPWYFALIFTSVYASFAYYLFATLHPQGTPADWESYFFSAGAGLGTLGYIYLCHRMIRKMEDKMPAGFYYGLLFLLTLFLFPVFYGIYWGVLVNRIIYRGGATVELALRESRLMIGVYQVPICFATILGLYNEKVFRLNQAILLKEKILSETRFAQLQQQVDPHFLFNNLNILSALIRQSPERAEQFSQRLSQLYRYHLRSGRQSLVSLRDELQYMYDYLYLLECRFGNAFRLDLQKGESIRDNEIFIVTGTLQLLLENVVKHNAASAKEPMTIHVRIDEQQLVMQNEIRPREAVSEGVGLKNLEHRYEILAGKPITVLNMGNSFEVTIPLIKPLK
nr:histidine kinase [uncultured Chitinophaga sp.]